MNFIPRLIGCLQYNILSQLLFGAGLGIFVILTHQPKFILPIDRNVLGLTVVIISILHAFAIRIFYTFEKYLEFLVREHGTNMHVTLVRDPYFYPTIIKDIGMEKKIAGYLYAFTKIWIFIIFGMTLLLVGTGHSGLLLK